MMNECLADLYAPGTCTHYIYQVLTYRMSKAKTKRESDDGKEEDVFLSELWELHHMVGHHNDLATVCLVHCLVRR